MSRLPAALAVALALCTTQGAHAGAAVPEPDGYRMEDYRAPVPGTLSGAGVLDTEEAHALWTGGEAVFVDVLPRPPRPKLPAGTLWRPPERQDIPGSIWLANTGFGALAPETEDYFETSLLHATEGDRTRALVFYCLRDCWMSWNAARRAMAQGYETVFWYPDGTDGWEEAGLPLETREPAPPHGQ